jgi:hypothetical protein
MIDIGISLLVKGSDVFVDRTVKAAEKKNNYD